MTEQSTKQVSLIEPLLPNIDEYKAITQKSGTHNYKYVVLSSFPSLNFG